jgi:hypothetical protein
VVSSAMLWQPLSRTRVLMMMANNLFLNIVLLLSVLLHMVIPHLAWFCYSCIFCMASARDVAVLCPLIKSTCHYSFH